MKLKVEAAVSTGSETPRIYVDGKRAYVKLTMQAYGREDFYEGEVEV